MKSFVIWALISILLIGGIGGTILYYTHRPGTPIDMTKIIRELDKEKKMSMQQASVYDQVGESQSDHGGEILTETVKSIEKKQSHPKTVLKYFFASLVSKDSQAFMSYMDGDTVSKDLFAQSNPDKEQVLESYMRNFSHNYSIKKVSILGEKGAINQDVTITVRIIYDDGITKKVPIKMVAYKPTHTDGSKVFYVKTSLRALVKAVEE